MWKEKLVAFLEGLEVENIPMLLNRGSVGDYRFLGQVMAQRTKDHAERKPLTPISEVRQNSSHDTQSTKGYSPIVHL